MIKNKSAQGHVEIIFSFVIFILFLSLLLFFFNPFKTENRTETYLDLVQNQIEKRITKEIDLLTLSINQSSSVSGCKYFPYNYSKNNSIITKDLSENIFSSNYDYINEKIYINFLDTNKFYLIYFSDDFNATSGCNDGIPLESGNYTLGLLRTYDVVSFKQLNENLSIEYNNNYNDLKKKIGIPQTKDFALNFYKIDKTPILNLGKSPEKTITYARTVPIQLVYENGTFIYGFMQIKIW